MPLDLTMSIVMTVLPRNATATAKEEAEERARKRLKITMRPRVLEWKYRRYIRLQHKIAEEAGALHEAQRESEKEKVARHD